MQPASESGQSQGSLKVFTETITDESELLIESHSLNQSYIPLHNKKEM